MSDTDLYAMLQLVPGRHGWAIGDTPEPTDTGLAQAALPPTTIAPPPVQPAGQQPQLNRAPAALGAPPGEEAFPPQAPAVPAEAFMQFEGSVTTETPNSDWSSLQGPSPTDMDVWSGAPSLVEQEAAPGLKTPQRGGRSLAPPVPERILLSSAGHCRTAAPCFYAVQIRNQTGPGHPPHRGF